MGFLVFRRYFPPYFSSDVHSDFGGSPLSAPSVVFETLNSTNKVKTRVYRPPDPNIPPICSLLPVVALADHGLVAFLYRTTSARCLATPTVSSNMKEYCELFFSKLRVFWKNSFGSSNCFDLFGHHRRDFGTASRVVRSHSPTSHIRNSDSKLADFTSRGPHLPTTRVGI